ncbi:MAG: DUF192 domain-containing protein [Phycisphaeraceae bacterium]|nr:DUF192 domain-containing protein [Phycisphaeraceae bacterium]
MNWTHKLAILIAVVAVMIGMVVAQGSGGSASTAPKRSPAGLPIETIRVNGEAFETEIAADDASRAKGLGGRTSIGAQEAMLFVFRQSDIQRFWMKDCLMDVDIVFLDRTGRITATHEMKQEPAKQPGESDAQYQARLPFYSSDKEALYAMEFKAGTIQRLGLKPGQTITLDHGKMRAYLR